MTEKTTFDIEVAGKKTGEAFDVNPVVIETDEQCKVVLLKLKQFLSLTEQETALLDSCLVTVSAEVGDDISFGPKEILELSILAQKYPDSATEIVACSQHLCASVECDGDLPPNIFAMMASAHGSLAAALGNGNDNEDDLSDESDDDGDLFDLIDTSELIQAVASMSKSE